MDLGRGALLAKIDIKNPYHIMPVHPSDRPLLDMSFNKSTSMQLCPSAYSLYPKFSIPSQMPYCEYSMGYPIYFIT